MAKKIIKSINLLPEIFRTNKNSKFLSSTIDQLIQPPELERIDGYVGSKLTPTYISTTDNYISESLPLRRNYQLEPAMVIKDNADNVNDVIGIDDLTNEIATKGGKNSNFDKLFRSEVYSYDPHIDWDKLINYQEYYWMITGPDTVIITGQQQNSTSTYTVQDNNLGSSFILNPDGLTEDPLITLYRGNTYQFEVSSAYGFYIKTSPTTGTGDQYNFNVTNNGTSDGVITFTVGFNTPDTLYYTNDSQQFMQGQFSIKTLDQDSEIRVDEEIIGKKNYTSGLGIKLSNGMKIKFGGNVFPESYQDKDYFVEGVGKSIRLVDYELLTTSQSIKNIYNDNFDVNMFDDYPFDNFKSLPLTPEYITINRASQDVNPWSKYNRWVHGSVIKTSAEANGLIPVYPADRRARRPIIEFNANLKLFNFGSIGIDNVDLIDTETSDAFSNVVGSAGYYVDGILLEQGHRVIFNADTDSTVRNKIFQVNFVTLNGRVTLELQDTETNIDNANIGVTQGESYEGTNWWFDGDAWQFSQQHDKLNQAPLFDLFDNQGNSYSDSTHYQSNFAGNHIFGYDVGTGSNDTVLGFPLKYKNSYGVGSYLFKNYFMSDEITIAENNQSITTIPTGNTYCKFLNDSSYANVWSSSIDYQIPVIQFQSIETPTLTLELTAIESPSTSDLTLEIFVNNDKIESYTTSIVGTTYLITFDNELNLGDNVLFKIYTDSNITETGYYELPLSLTNNPLNGPILSLTLSELSDHLHTAVHRSPDFLGNYPGASNLRDISDIAAYGSRLVSNANPLVFANFFIGKKEHSVIDALSKSADQYNQFKLSLLKKISEIDTQTEPVSSLDRALKELNGDKDLLSPHYLSDMIAYGTDKTVRTWTVTNVRNVVYPIASDFNPAELSMRSVLVYLNGVQLLRDQDYEFIVNDSSIRILTDIAVGDEILVNDYFSTEGSFVPSTPTKLGLYPKYTPAIFEDSSYINGPVNVIQGHDGSIMLAYNDFRDDIILEFEKRVYNNIKTEYREELININSVLPGAFRDTDFSVNEVNDIIQRDFIKWAGFYGVDYTTNDITNSTNSLTWNYRSGYNSVIGQSLNGFWRSVFKYLYDTDRPNTHPWEMLGFTEKPTWWEDEYGPAPYTSGNDVLWEDLATGTIRRGSRAGVNKIYARPQLSQLLPVNSSGNLVDPATLVSNVTEYNKRQSWNFGDQAPAETVWRRSSYWPFTVQKLLALTNPAVYASLMYDTSRVVKNLAGQWTYGSLNEFLNIKNVLIHDDEKTQTSGYSVFVSEVGQQRSKNYIQELKQDIGYIDFNLFYKAGGFVSKDKLQIVIDAYDPTSTSPGALLPQENYNLILNTSNPVKSISISGIIIQVTDGKYVVQGYDVENPYFRVYEPVRNSLTSTITVGGISESYVVWTNGTSSGATGLSSADTTTAISSPTGKFYQAGQLVSYANNFYRVKVNHQSGATFNQSYFQIMPSLPVTGGATVQTANKFGNTVKLIPYKTEFSTIQEVYDLIVGYGRYLETQGFIFDDYNSEFNSTIDWYFSGKEFLYWTTQNWANNSVITLSPFAGKIKYQLANTVVDNIFDSFYQYSLLKASGLIFPQENLSVNRDDGVCTIETINSTDGIYFATIHSVQKEHAMVFNNTTVFNDVIYDIETGYRQRRMKLTGFRTANWNGDYFSPGFVYDAAQVSDWKQYTDYKYGDVVKFASYYYSANKNVSGTSAFDFTKWTTLGEKPVAGLLPNFDYKINQFEDFYSLDIDNFDSAQQKMAQHLTGYTPRVYLNNIFTNPISQYKFYQGFIKEKGTRNSINKLAKASIQNLQGQLDFKEEWAFRIGNYGSFETYQELEIPLTEGKFIENPQVINFTNSVPSIPNDLIYYSTTSDRIITPTDYIPSATFPLDTDSDFEFKLQTAGYVRLDDVTATAYNEQSIFDIVSNENISENDTIWLGFKKDGNWDVLRYIRVSVDINDVSLDINNFELTFRTTGFHGLSEGEIVSITQFNSQVNGVYTIKSVPTLTSFVVATELTFVDNLLSNKIGALYKFVTARFENYDQLPSDNELLALPDDSKFWVDKLTNNGSAINTVYQKVNNYKSVADTGTYKTQQLGYSISKPKGSNIFVVGSPAFTTSTVYGKVTVYEKINDTNVEKLSYYGSTQSEFGSCVVYDNVEFNDTGYGLVFVGAPAYSNSYTQQGSVRISSINSTLLEEVTEITLTNPTSNYQRFGSSIYVQHSTGTKTVLVGSPGTLTTGTGSVYKFLVTASGSTVTAGAAIAVTTSSVTAVGSQWGYSISGSDNCSIVAISAPGHSTGTGLVSIFTGTATTFLQTIASPFGQNGRFGETVLVSNDGTQLFVSAPDVKHDDRSFGAVVIYKYTTSSNFVLDQILVNPASNAGMHFGRDIDVTLEKDLLIISALGDNKNLYTTFDKSAFGETTFDSKSTRYFAIIKNAGTVYVYNRKDTRFVLVDNLESEVVVQDSWYGKSIAIDSDVILVGAPAINSTTTNALYQFNRIDTSFNGFKVLSQRDDPTMIDAIQKIMLINSYTEEIVDYLDIVDPLKGKIVGVAEQELKYKSAFDPAVYSTGISTTVNDTNTNWLDEHVGELWWDLSTAKYVWYEQSNLTYRKNNWGKLFPGASIDVYEWVSSEYLPSEWSEKADTSVGLTEGISGQPKFNDNTVVSVKQVYNPATNSFSNRYYFWVKNKITVPDVKNRRISSYQVSSIINDPTAFGMRYAAIIDSDSIALANVGPLLVDNRIHLNIAIDLTNKNNLATNTLRHTEWLLLQEGSATSKPNTLLEKKLIDSLLGHDSLGNPVPDPSLTSRTRYGIGIRPQQTLFKDRQEALRNLIEFTNSVLLENRISENYSFSNLNKQDNIPDEYSFEYDQIVEDNEGLLIIDTRLFVRPELTCTVDNGKIRSVQIVNPGFGYKISPTVNIISNVVSTAVITTEIDEFGRVIGTNVVDPGNGFIESPTLEVRQYTVIVQADTQFNGKWSKFIFNLDTEQWTRIGTQEFNTPLYWNYIDWSSTNYNPYVDYVATVDDVYEVNKLTLLAGQYVKVKNGGNGSYIILEKVDTDKVGTFSVDYDIVYSENGTIQISNSIWDTANSTLGFDQVGSFDQTLYDQTPDLELQYILSALKNDIFINELKINWNLFFFKAVKYALTEQKLLDWAFKTSFINVVNYAGNLDQRPVYKISSSDNYKQYLEEVKPYHTNIRSFTANHTVLERSQTYTTDFDLPSVYNKSTGIFESIEIGSDKLEMYPWKSWADNYTYQVGGIVVGTPGTGYLLPPTVDIVTAPGDTGSGASAKAYISSGGVSAIEVINAGSGYKKAPIITLNGNGTGAVAYAQLVNGKVRTNKISMKFDRVSDIDQIGSKIATDRFICNGSNGEFILNWLAEPSKLDINITLDGSLVLGADYTVEYYTEEYNGYNKKFSKIVFLNYVPAAEQVLQVTYAKNTTLFNATERILNYYNPTSGMPGSDLSQLMMGIDYPKTKIEGLLFTSTQAWDLLYPSGEATPFGISSYADDVNYYTKSKVASTATTGTATIILSTTTGIKVGQYANIISTTTNMFTTTSVVVTGITTSTGAVTFSSTITGMLFANTLTYQLEFWNYDSNSNLLDSAIEGGNLGYSTALGINPDDITIDGEGFYTPNTSHAPEEFVPGQASESVGINVYTKNLQGAPVVYSGSIGILASNSTITRQRLGMRPTSVNNITVSFNNRLFGYSQSMSFTSTVDSDLFSIDWETNEIIIGPQSTSGLLGYTVMSIGGGIDSGMGVIDTAVSTGQVNEQTVQVVSLSSFDSVNSVYVTLNGVPISTTISGSVYYVFTYANENDKRAAVNVINLPFNQVNTVQAWFFGTQFDYFNEIREQIFTITSSTDLTFNLTNPPGTVEPVVASGIVEYYNPANNTRQRLVPPDIEYYQISSLSTSTFAINNQGNFDALDGTIRVYKNGIALTGGFNFTVNNTNKTVTITSGIALNDVVAIVTLPTGVDQDYAYDITGSTLTLKPSGITSQLSWASTSTGEIKVLTYKDNNNMLVRTERFDGNPNRRFKISRPIYDVNYVWVQLNGVPLISGLDYEILDDQITIQISDAYYISSTDFVVITSMVTQELATTIVGYRIFNDMFNRTHFKRLAKKNTTYLTQPLNFYDTEIHVADSDALAPPLLAMNIPGVVIIDGERIEFFKMDKNILRQLRRSTLGTAPSFYSDIGTKVIDQSPDQTIPFSDTIKNQYHFTTATTNAKVLDASTGSYTFVINTASFFTTVTNTTSTLESSGITLSTSTLINAVDQVQIFYGGRLLRKSGIYVQDTTISYDSPDTRGNEIESTSTVQSLPVTTEIGTAYTVTATNQVWVYTASTEPDSFRGYVYRGLTYKPAEFSINTSTQAVTLNIEGGIDYKVKLQIVKKEFTTSLVWNDINPADPVRTLSIMDSLSAPARFLQDRPAELPDKYYYGGSLTLTTSGGSPLTDLNNNPLEGF